MKEGAGDGGRTEVGCPWALGGLTDAVSWLLSRVLLQFIRLKYFIWRYSYSFSYYYFTKICHAGTLLLFTPSYIGL